MTGITGPTPPGQQVAVIPPQAGQLTDQPNRPDDQPQHDEAPSNELLGLISPDRSRHEKWKEAVEFVEEFSARLQKRQEYAERCYFGEADKPCSRRTLN